MGGGVGVIALLLTAGCTASGSHLLGAEPDTRVVTTSHVAQAKPVTLRGTMIEKCPVAACWYKLKDSSGVVHVDVKGANFTVADVPTGATVTVSGTLTNDGGEPTLAATGMRW